MATSQMTSEFGPVVETDVLILGGGLAGIFAGIAAREAGREVLIVDKAHIERSGEAGAGNDHFMCQLYTDPSWDTDVDMAEFMATMSDKFIEPEVALNVSRNMPKVRQLLEDMGIEFHRDPATGAYMRSHAFGARGPMIMMVKGTSAKQLKPVLVNALRSKGVRMLNRVMVTKLLIQDGQPVGATAFGVRTGEFYTLRAKTIVLATGNISRTCSESTTHNPYNIWRSPFNTGDGHAIAWQAGIELEDMGILGSTLLPKGFGSPGVCGIVGNGGYLVNALGERYMFNYSPKGESAERSTLVMGTFKEIQAGRGPCYFDLRHLPLEVITFVRKNLLSVDRDTFDDFLTQKGLDPSKDLLEYEIGETSKWNGGIAVDANLQTNIPGIFAAGQCGVGDTFPTAAASGYLAGLKAAHACEQSPNRETADVDQIASERQRVFAPLNRKEGLTPARFEQMFRQVNEHYVNLCRNQSSLTTAIESLRKLGAYADQIAANNYHELMRATEAKNLLVCSELIALSSLERKESRFGSGFYRSDYPDADPAFHGMQFMKRVNGVIKFRFKPIDPDAFELMRRAQ